MILVLSGGYLIIIWIWSPYMPAINFHNKALRLNHMVAFIFAIFCEILNKVDLSPVFGMILVYASLALLGIVGIVCCSRIYVEYKFRQKLEDDPRLL